MEVEKLRKEYPEVHVRWVPYLLNPTIPPEGQHRTPQTTADAPKSALELRGEAVGITFRRGRTFTPNSHLALEAAENAVEHGHDSDALHRALFKANFEDFENIGDIDVLVRIGSEQGLDGGELREVLESGSYRDTVDRAIEWARSVGVTGIPTFIFNEKYAIVGAQEYPAFQGVMAKLAEEARAEAESQTGEG